MLVYFMLLVLLVYWLDTRSNRLEQSSQEKKQPCDLHDWSYHPVTKKLTCTECGFVAGGE
jgi:hypothetical protein